ncbi:MAG: glycine--tRNA ligase subunit alpha [Rickettsiales bacterium]
MFTAKSFQGLIFLLQEYWHKQGCVILQPYDLEMGAGTFHTATSFLTLGSKPYKLAYVQPSRRPTDGRYGQHPNRLFKYHQFQVILKPSPSNIQELYLKSLEYLGIDPKKHDIRFVEDDWESPTLGASGLGWEVWCDGMEVSQFTYMQQMGGIECEVVSGELTYGLERIALYLQNKKDIKDLLLNESTDAGMQKKYSDLYLDSEYQYSRYSLESANVGMLSTHFNDSEKEVKRLVGVDLPIPAYEFCIKASHLFNTLDAMGVLSVTERGEYISRVRDMVKQCCKKWLELEKKNG